MGPNLFDSLPKNLRFMIFEIMPVKDLLNCCAVSKGWNTSINQDRVWIQKSREREWKIEVINEERMKDLFYRAWTSRFGTPKELKIVLVGDGAVGKTSMVITFTQKKFPVDYVPTVSDYFEADLYLNECFLRYSLWDTAGPEAYSRIRTLSYPKTDIFLICFSVVKLESFDNIKERWIPEIQHHCPNFKFILVGTQIDLRTNERFLTDLRRFSKVPVTYEKGEKLAKETGAIKYMECSALTGEGLDDLFYFAFAGEPVKKLPKKGCLIF
eukprot:TRINITY_DN15836_c0_g1_i1.p1 TRINITY_DN15836_c0_g1~~TRINITY_DN15836_c0_g1_i1.p1  ORF type:complete len:269 (-),score=52.04 TRINITY_DN15836_c0_g1_i1:14-820(-)